MKASANQTNMNCVNIECTQHTLTVTNMLVSLKTKDLRNGSIKKPENGL